MEKIGRPFAVLVGGIGYLVQFTFEHFPDEGIEVPSVHDFRKPYIVTDVTTCKIDPELGGTQVRGIAMCSASEPYNHMKGCRLALDRATATLLTPAAMPLGVPAASLPHLQRRFREAVMPVLAARLRKRKPGNRALRRENARLRATLLAMEAAVMMIGSGV